MITQYHHLLLLLLCVSWVTCEFRFNQRGDIDFVPTITPTSTIASFVYIPLPDTSARCLDGSQYGIFICKGTSNSTWTIGIQGGGWCYNELDCHGRAGTPLGSSITWPAQAARMACDINQADNYVMMYYGDGASFTGYREQPWPVPGTDFKLTFRGSRNLDATLDLLLSKYGLSEAKLLILTGGSAGGLSTFLHLDHVASRVPNARTVGQPVCGFFLDHGYPSFVHPKDNKTYTERMQYVFNMQNSTGSLSSACQKAHAPYEWMCILAPHAAPFIQTPWFALQSRFDHWQLSEELYLPCMLSQNYAPPFKPPTCNTNEITAIKQYGPDFMTQFRPLMTGTKNGAFLDACIIHGSTNSTIDGKTNREAFNSWLAGGQQWYTMKCQGSDSAGPCDTSPICAPI